MAPGIIHTFRVGAFSVPVAIAARRSSSPSPPSASRDVRLCHPSIFTIGMRVVPTNDQMNTWLRTSIQADAVRDAARPASNARTVALHFTIFHRSWSNKWTMRRDLLVCWMVLLRSLFGTRATSLQVHTVAVQTTYVTASFWSLARSVYRSLGLSKSVVQHSSLLLNPSDDQHAPRSTSFAAHQTHDFASRCVLPQKHPGTSNIGSPDGSLPDLDAMGRIHSALPSCGKTMDEIFA